MSPKAISLFFIYMGSVSIVVSYVFFTHWVHRIHVVRWIKGFAVVGILLHLGYAWVGTSTWALYGLITLDNLTLALMPGLLDGLVGQATPPEQRGHVFGIGQLLTSLANIATTLVFSLLSIWSLEWPFYWFALCFLALLWLKIGPTSKSLSTAS